MELSRKLGISASYLNQLEHNQRPLTVPVLLKLCSALGTDAHYFSDEDEARVIAELREAFSVLPAEQSVAAEELRTLASDMPALARAVVALHQRYREATVRSDALASQIGETGRTVGQSAVQMPFEEVRDFFYTRHNYIAELEEVAESIHGDPSFASGDIVERLSRRLGEKHGVRIVLDENDDETAVLRKYDARHKLLTLAPYLHPGQRAFQLATQLAFLEASDVLQRIARAAPLGSDETRALARIGLASYFAGALLMPYAPFLEAAEEYRYDADRLSRRFGVGFEPICHRLSTLQRPDARGVPFFFVRVDRAGNISKRQSATDFHFSRVGGTCPLWNVYEAFAQPGRILTQLARMPDDRTYLWIARTVSSGSSFGKPDKTFAIGLGCDVRHAERLVYSKGLDLRDPSAPTPIGAGCRICDRPACPQRAFPRVGRALVVDQNESRATPYPAS